MEDIEVAGTFRQRFDDIVGRRRDGWLIAGVVGAVVVSALVVAGRGTPSAIASAPSAAPAYLPAEASAGAPGILVHVAGAVKRPGLYELNAGARVADAVAAAGGPRRRADLDLLNLARVLADGEKVMVVGAGGGHGYPMPPDALGTSPNAPVAINSADATALETIPGIGPAKAAAIIQLRSELGGFASIEQLLDVRGIGPATLESMRPYITL